MAHAEAGRAAADFRQDDDVARRDAAAGQLGERCRRHDDDVQLAFDGVAQGRRQHRGAAERRGELVRARREAGALARGENDDGALGGHGSRMGERRRNGKWEVYVRPSP